MGSTVNQSRAPRRRRIATALAAAGAVVASTGLVLMTTATPASATKPGDDGEHKVYVCHATSSDTNPYVVIHVDVASTRYKGHLMHRDSPNKTWKDAGTWNGTQHSAGDSKRDFIEGMDFEGYPSFCDKPGGGGEEEDETEVVAKVEFRDPTCDDKSVDYQASAWLADGGDMPEGLVEFEVTGGAKEPGSSIEVTATITDNDYEFDNEDTEQVFSHTFGNVPDNCDEDTTPSTPSNPQPSESNPNPPVNPPGPPAVVPPVVKGSESVAPQPEPQQPGEVAGTESSKPKPHANKPKGQRPAVVLGTEAAVPTAVDAGLGSLPGAAPAQGSLLGQLLTGAGVALMLAAGWLMTMGRRKAGAREA